MKVNKKMLGPGFRDNRFKFSKLAKIMDILSDVNANGIVACKLNIAINWSCSFQPAARLNPKLEIVCTSIS